MSNAIQYTTVSHSNRGKNNGTFFLDFQELLVSSYPAVTAHLNRYSGEDFGYAQNASLLYRWSAGKNEKTPAILLMAHYDVVAIEQTSVAEWHHPPFSGVVEDGYLWGRGTLDNRDAAIALMEACL